MEDAGIWAKVAVYLMLGVFPWAFVVAGGWLVWSAHRFMSRAQRVTATVVSVQEQTSTCRSNDHTRVVTTFRPVFAYPGPDGETRQVEPFLNSNAYDFPVGTEKEILVSPDDPGIARMPGLMIYGFGGIFIAGGTVFGLLCLFALSAL